MKPLAASAALHDPKEEDVYYGLEEAAAPSLERGGSGLIYPFLAGAGGLFALVSVATLPFLVIPWLPRKVFGALPYMNTPNKKLQHLFEKILPRFQVSSTTKKNQSAPSLRFIDLGSGAGEAVIEAAKHGYKAKGIELNPTLHVVASYKAWRSGISGSTSFSCGNMWMEDLKQYDAIMIFGVAGLMPRLNRKILDEARHGSLVITYRFTLPSPAAIGSLSSAKEGKDKGKDEGVVELLEVEEEMSIYRVFVLLIVTLKLAHQAIFLPMLSFFSIMIELL